MYVCIYTYIDNQLEMYIATRWQTDVFGQTKMSFMTRIDVSDVTNKLFNIQK